MIYHVAVTNHRLRRWIRWNQLRTHGRRWTYGSEVLWNRALYLAHVTAVLRFAADIFTEGLMLLARSINPSAPTLFRATLSPYAKSYKPPRNSQSAPQLS